jgi:hypothetical protein
MTKMLLLSKTGKHAIPGDIAKQEDKYPYLQITVCLENPAIITKA